MPTLTEGYALENIFNADETGLYYCALPTKSMVAKNDSAAGVKMAKNRITVLLAASATGEKLKPVATGNALKPQCFQGLDINSLGIEYYHNMKAWMTGIIFSTWATKLNNKLRIQG